MSTALEAKDFTTQQIRAAIIANCVYWGSQGYFIEAELDWYERRPEGIRLFRDASGVLRAWHIRNTDIRDITR